VPDDALLEAADTLYALPLPEFTPARDAMAKELKAGDKELAARVKAFRKPSVAAWVVNLLVRRDAAQVDQILGVGGALRDAQANLDASELRALTRQRRQLTSAVTGRAKGFAAEAGQKVTDSVADQVEATLTAAMVDEGAAEAVRSGLLVAALSSTGVGELDLTSAVAVPDAAGFTPSELGEPAPPEPPDLHVVPDPEADQKKRTAAEEALAQAEAEVDRATKALDEATAEVEELEARSLQVQAEIDELRRRLGELETEQDDVDDQIDDARGVVAAARADVSAADKGRARAAAALDKLRLGKLRKAGTRSSR
jgi:DNA repair exonuclease SbcCD ATPase subunit